jgi:hypothetical protein
MNRTDTAPLTQPFFRLEDDDLDDDVDDEDEFEDDDEDGDEDEEDDEDTPETWQVHRPAPETAGVGTNGILA